MGFRGKLPNCSTNPPPHDEMAVMQAVKNTDKGTDGHFKQSTGLWSDGEIQNMMKVNENNNNNSTKRTILVENNNKHSEKWEWTLMNYNAYSWVFKFTSGCNQLHNLQIEGLYMYLKENPKTQYLANRGAIHVLKRKLKRCKIKQTTFVDVSIARSMFRTIFYTILENHL